MTVVLVLTLAWGALAFGAVYPWTYIPLAIACVMIALLGFVPRRDRAARRINMGLVVGIALVALVPFAQLVPLSHDVLLRVSPGTDAFLQKYDMQYKALIETQALIKQPADKAGRGAEGARTGGSESPELKFGAHGSGTHPVSIDPAQTALGLALFAAFATMLVGLARGLTARDARRFVPALVVLGVVLALVGIITKATWGGRVYGLWEPYEKTVTPFGPFVNRNHFAGWMLMALPVGIGYFSALVSRGMRELQPRPGQTRIDWHQRLIWFSSADANRVGLVGFGLLVMGLSLVLTLSRSGIIGLCLVVALMAVAGLRRQARKSKKALVASYVVLVLAIAAGWAGLDAIAARFEKIDIDYKDRAAIWDDALHIFHDFPVLGSGLDTFGRAMLVYQTADPKVTYTEAHNDYLQILAEGGVSLAAAALVLLALFAREVRRRFREETGFGMTYWIRVGAVTGLIAIALQEAAEFSLQMPGNAALFVTLMAIAAGRLPHRHPRLVERVPSSGTVRQG